MKDNKLFLSGSALKIIGMISMVFDHIMVVFYSVNKSYLFDINTNTLFRIIGRLAFVIFAFLTVESILKTSNKIKYLLRMGILAVIMDLGMYIAMGSYGGNPVTTLFLGALTIYFLEDKKIYKKLLAFLPISYTLLIALEVIPLYADYDIYGLSTILIFYIAYLISNWASKYIITVHNLDEETFNNSNYKLHLRNTISSILFLSFSMIIYFVNPIWNNKGLFTEMNSIQVYAVFGLIPIMLYNGKRGYNKKWFQYGSYLFFPLHIIIIYLIALIVV